MNGSANNKSKGGRPRNPPRASVDREWFQGVLRKLGKTQKEWAAAIGRAEEMLTRSLTGERKFDVADVYKSAAFLNVSLEDVYERLGYPPRSIGVPIAGRVLGNGDVSPMHPRLGEKADITPLRDKAEAFVAETKGTALEAYDGAVFVCGAATGPVPAEAVGRLCRIEAEGGVVPVLAVLHKSTGKGLFNYTVLGAKDMRTQQRVHRAAIVLAIFFP